MSAHQQWQPGDVVALRYLMRTTGHPGAGWPLRVVEDRDDLVALFLQRGSRFRQVRRVEGAYKQTWDVWRRDTLRLMYPGRGYSVWLSWNEAGSQRSFRSYYVNMEEPFRRTSIGFDTNDHQLDIVVQPDLTWSWKDEDIFEEFARIRIYSQPFAEHVRREASKAVDLIEAEQPPFRDGWEEWTPDPSWTVPELAQDWEDASPEPWERRDWAYLNRA